MSVPMEKIFVTREFIMEKGSVRTTLADPDPTMSAQQVLKVYSHSHPELVTASVVGPEYRGDRMLFTFKTCVGTKG